MSKIETDLRRVMRRTLQNLQDRRHHDVVAEPGHARPNQWIRRSTSRNACANTGSGFTSGWPVHGRLTWRDTDSNWRVCAENQGDGCGISHSFLRLSACGLLFEPPRRFRRLGVMAQPVGVSPFSCNVVTFFGCQCRVTRIQGGASLLAAKAPAPSRSRGPM